MSIVNVRDTSGNKIKTWEGIYDEKEMDPLPHSTWGLQKCLEDSQLLGKLVHRETTKWLARKHNVMAGQGVTRTQDPEVSQGSAI